MSFERCESKQRSKRQNSGTGLCSFPKFASWQQLQLDNLNNRWMIGKSIGQSMPINQLLSIIDEQSMLEFYVIIDFIDYQFLSIINTNRSVNLHQLSSKRFPKHSLFMHQIMMKTAMKLKFFHNGDWYIVENMGTRFYRPMAEWQRVTNIH